MAQSALGKTVAAPPADASRVAAIRNSLNLADPEGVAAFGERARREVLAGVERLLSEVRGRDLIEAEEIIRHLSETAGELDPAVIDRGGGFWPFGGRGARLKRLRNRFESASVTVDGLVSDLVERAERLGRKVEALNGLHEQTRTFILELDAYLEAGRAKLSDARRAEAAEPAPAPPEPAEGEASAETETETAAEAPAAPARRPTELLADRLAELEAARAAAVGQLPLVRIVQNVDAPLGDRLSATAEAVRTWRRGWAELLGLGGAKRRGRPDAAALAEARAALQSALAAPLTVLAEGRARRGETETRMEKTAQAVRKPQA